MDNAKLLTELFDPKQLSILRCFFRHPETQFILLDIAKETHVSTATTFRIVHKLASIGIVKTIKINKFKLYQLNANDNTAFLQQFLREEVHYLKSFLQAIEGMPSIESVILHGEEAPNKANLLIIGNEVNAQQLKELAAEFREKYDFTISFLTLAAEQYQQMSAMGLYSGKKKVLFKRE